MQQILSLCDFVKATQKIFNSVFKDQIEKYLSHKRGISKKYILDILLEQTKLLINNPLLTDKLRVDLQKDIILKLLRTVLIYDIKINIKYKQKIKSLNVLTSRMSLLDFLSNGFLQYTFKSKYFWGYDKILYDLGLYNTCIRFLSYNKLNNCGKKLFLLKNMFGKHWLLSSKSQILKLGHKLRLYEINKVYKIARICF